MLSLLLASAVPVMAAPDAARASVPEDPALIAPALAECVIAPAAPDACFELQLARVRQMMAEGKAHEAGELARAARGSIFDAFDPLWDAIGRIEVRGEREGLTDADRAQIAALKEQFRQLWLDTARAAQLRAEAMAPMPMSARAVADAYGQAISTLQEHGRTDAERLRWLALVPLRARALASGADIAAAETELTEAIALIEREPAPSAEPALRLELAEVLARRGRQDAALAEFARARDAATRVDEAAVLAADLRQAQFLAAIERRNAAAELARDVIRRIETGNGARDQLASAYLALAAVTDDSDAIPLVRRAVELQAAQYGDASPQAAQARFLLGVIYHRLDMLDDAAAVLERAYNDISALRWNSDTQVMATQLELAMVQFWQSDVAAAKVSATQLMYGLMEVYGENHPETAKALWLLGMIAIAEQDRGYRPLFNRALAAVRSTLPRTDRLRLQVEYSHALVLLAVEGNPAAAYPELRSVARAGIERTESEVDFSANARRELRQFAPVFRDQVRAAWVLGAGR